MPMNIEMKLIVAGIPVAIPWAPAAPTLKMVTDSGPVELRPWPGRSNAITSCRRDRSAICRSR